MHQTTKYGFDIANRFCMDWCVTVRQGWTV